MFDVVYVSYNSEKWIDKCFASWKKVNYDLKDVNIYVVDNHSKDNTVKCLEEVKRNMGDMFGCFEIISENENRGFGKGNNIGFKKGDSDIVCFINIDTEMFEDTLSELEREINVSDEMVGLWEFRQFPYEHPKIYDPLTGSTDWSSGAAFAVRRDLFEEIGGFDEKIFMYAEDVDLSWRIRCKGYILKYVPRVKIMHYSYESAGEVKPNQYVFSLVNNLLLRYRFGKFSKIVIGHLRFWNIMRKPEAFQGARKLLFKQYMRHFLLIPHFFAGGKYRKTGKKVVLFRKWDYTTNRDGAFYENFLPAEKPLVSIIVRTCGRPSVLRETLISLKNQTYDNIQIVIVEDGAPVAKKMIEEEFASLNISYHATGEKVGRSHAGNLAMQLAKGEYLNFLDDDDLFYADHVEVLVANILKSGKRAAYSTSFETPIEIESKEPYRYCVKDYLCIHRQAFDKVILCHHNYIPIQCIMFEKKLFDEYGGLDETVDALEDWDMWVRYSLHTDFEFIFKTTSIYRVPAQKDDSAKRQKELDDALIVMRNKHKSYQQVVSVYDLAMMYQENCR